MLIEPRPRPKLITWPPTARVAATCSPLMSPRTNGSTPQAFSPTIRRRVKVDFPRPGEPKMKHEGLRIKLRWNQVIGSQQTVVALSRWGPIGTPSLGASAPTVNGYSPHACTVVARLAGGTQTTRDIPPPRPGQPREEGQIGRILFGRGVFGVFGLGCFIACP